MPQCRLPDGRVIFVGSCQDCDKSYNGACLDDPTGGVVTPPGTVFFCFVRNVLVRTLADALLDAGACETITESALKFLTLGEPVQERPDAGQRPLTPALRQELAEKLAGGMMQLASTYRTTVDFRDRILLHSPRGRELKAHYDTHLGEIYRQTSLDLELLQEAATTWLSVHPFVAAMVELARDGEGAKHEKVHLTAEQFERSNALIGRFRHASPNEHFRRVLDEIERELEGYKGLSAAEALHRLRAAPAQG